MSLLAVFAGMLLISNSALASSGPLRASAFGGERTIIWAEAFECETKISGLVVEDDEWDPKRSGEGSVFLDTKIAQDYFDLRNVPEHESALYRNGNKPTEEEIREAQKKDKEHKERVILALVAEHKRVGLDPDPENVAYFFSGRAKMRVIECLQGGLKQGDELEVTWKHVLRRISCPPILPYNGKCGWVFDGKVEKNSKVSVGHGFWDIKRAREAKLEYEKQKGKTESGVSKEYRYNLMVTTGLQERVSDSSGKETTIVFSSESDPQSRFLLSKLLALEGVHGTIKKKKWKHGIPFNQGIILKGVLKPKIFKTKSGPSLPAAEEFQEFVLEGIQVQFPFSRHREGKVFDTGYLETHFSFGTLFPDGLKFEGEKLDLSKFTKPREEVAVESESDEANSSELKK